MARARPPKRISELAAAAVEVFIRAGYTRAQMAEVASTLGVAKGTVYLYVESKEALFDLAVRFAVGDALDAMPARLPLPAPAAGQTLQRIEEELAARGQMRRLLAALTTDSIPDIRAEARGIFEEIYETLQRNRVGLKLIDRCARDMPTLSRLWYRQSREALQGGLAAWIQRRGPQLRPQLDPMLTARYILETMAFWAIHRHWDPAPPLASDDVVQREVMEFLLRGVLHEDGPREVPTM